MSIYLRCSKELYGTIASELRGINKLIFFKNQCIVKVKVLSKTTIMNMKLRRFSTGELTPRTFTTMKWNGLDILKPPGNPLLTC